MADAVDESLEEVRTVLFGSEREELTALRARVSELEDLLGRVENLEELILAKRDRSKSISGVLPEAFADEAVDVEYLSTAMKSSTTRAIHHSARDESGDLAVALYPVIGPAVRKMIASLLSFGPPDGSTFAVRQVLLIERESGLLLAATAIDGETQDADIVSGMLDAIRLFVQDAFDTPEHDGLQDLRVGNTSVIVEWGPQAVLASVVQGVPDDAYRQRAAQLLEQLHLRYEGQLSAASGVSESLDEAIPLLHDLQESSEPERSWTPLIILAIVVIVIVLLIIWLA